MATTTRERTIQRVTGKGAIDPEEHNANEYGVAEFRESDQPTLGGSPREQVEAPEIVQTKNVDQEKLANLKFMNEPVTVHIHETSDPRADQIFDVSVNGKTEVFRRGETRKVKRYIVEGLMRAKPVHFSNEEYVDQDGVRKVRWPNRSGLRYGFSVTEDRNPLGPQWLKAVMSQP